MPKYCYEVWIKHLTMLNEHDSVPVPKTFAELGPGALLGVGLAALLSGADTYYALDIIKYSEVDLSLALLRRPRGSLPKPNAGVHGLAHRLGGLPRAHS